MIVALSFAALIGMCIGSFGNVLIDRLPAGISILGRSRCDGCHRTLTAVELLPIVSWILLRAKCRSCHAPISARVPFVEGVSGLLAVAAYAYTDHALIPAICFFCALWALLLIAVIDLRTRTIPDALTLTVFVSAIMYHWFSTGVVPVTAPIIGAVFFGVQWIFSRGRWVGSGDILLAAAIGMLLGTAQNAVWMLLLSYIIGANVAIVLLLLKRLSRHDMVPFGPFLVIAGYVVLFLGSALPPIL